MSEQHTALRLADDLELNHKFCPEEIHQQAAAELRRLHALCYELLSELYVYRASEHFKGVTAAIKARNIGEQV